jgi:ribonucleoside-triphosphate reductase
MKLRCGNCGYEWEYRGKGYYATCPKCRWKVSTRPETEKRRKRKKFEPVEFVENYLNQRDWKVRENANIPFSFSSLFLQGANEVIEEYVLKKVYPPKISRAHVEGDFHIHNIGWGIIGYCFDEETRVLTEEGFKYFRDVELTDRVATLNLNTGELEYQHPLAKQVFEYKGTMLRWRGRNVDLMVTPEHRMLVRMPTSRSSFASAKCPVCGRVFKSPRGAAIHVGKVHQTSGLKSRTVTPWKFVSAGELAKRRASVEFKKDARWRGTNHPFIEFTKSRFKCQKCKCWVPAKTSTCPKCGSNEIENLTEIKCFPIEPFLRFLGWYIAEGNVNVTKGGYRISIACLKSANRKRVAGIIRQLGLRPIIGKYHVMTHSKELYSYLLPLGKSKEKYIPPEIKKLSPRLIEIFLTELFRGDGQISNGKLKCYYTRSRKLAEDVVECLIKIGKCGTIGKDKKGGYVVSVIHKSLTPEFRGGPEYVPYEGKVYDLTVPNGTLLVERNGRIVWSGNCAGWSIKDLLLMGFGGVPARTESSPPKHFSSALLQISNFLGSIQNEWAGAQAINALDVYLAPFIRKDGLEFEEVKQRIQEFIYNLNISCFDDQTEILTKEGFKKFEDLTENDYVLTMNPVTHKIEWQKPTKVIKEYYVGPMVHIKNATFDFLVTPNHRWYVARQGSRKRYFTFVRADELKYNDRIPKQGIWEGKEVEYFYLPRLEKVERFYSPFSKKWHQRKVTYPEIAIKMDDWLAFLGIYLAEGDCTSRANKGDYIVEIHQERYKEAVRNILDKLPFKFSERKDRFIIYSRQLWEYLRKLGNSHSKYVPREFLELSRRQLQILFDSMMLGDGHKGKQEWIYLTSSKRLADNFFEICVKLGYCPRMFIDPYRKSSIRGRVIKPTKVCYRIKIKRSKWYTFGNLKSKNGTLLSERVDYKGKVYCCTVPNEIILVRRNGIVTWSGNSRWGGQTPFTNVTLEMKVPEDMKSEPIIIGGKLLDETYGDYQPEIDLFNKAFLEVLLEGDARGRVFTFPIPTVNITPDFPWDSEVSDLLFKVTAKFGSFYFQNCVKGGLDPREIRAMCCRLQLDLRELYRRYGFFGYADKTGSVGVVTINMPRIGFLSKDEREFFERLDRLLELAKESLEIKRRVVEKLMKEGLLPFSARYLGSLRWHFSTIGLIGMHEACLNFLGEGIETRQGKEFAIKVLKHMRERIKEFQEETGNLYNLEATPAEGASHRLARLDKERFPKIKTAGKDVPYYTNSTWLPVGYTSNLAEALRHQEDLQVLYNGGTVFHTFLGESPDPAACKLLVRRIAENFAIPYYTLTPTFSICPDHGYLSGEHWNCPTCGKPCEVYSRIVGYYRPVQNWHIGKQEEFKERLEYSPSL